MKGELEEIVYRDESVLKVCQESRLTSQILLKNKFLCFQTFGKYEKSTPKVLAQRQKTAAKFIINLCTNAFVESLMLNVYVSRRHVILLRVLRIMISLGDSETWFLIS